jgi:hypothetical protein
MTDVTIIEWMGLEVHGIVDIDEGWSDREGGYPPSASAEIDSIHFCGKRLPDVAEEAIIERFGGEIEELLIDAERGREE